MHPRIAPILIGIALGVAFGVAQLRWAEKTQADFADGWFSDGIFASQRGDGAVEFAARFDLNADGYTDIVCPDDSGPWLRVYYGGEDGFDSARSTYLPIEAGGGVAMADVDYDGHPELIHSGWRGARLVVYRGTPDGPSPVNPMLVNRPGNGEAVTVQDLDRDGWLDLASGSTDRAVFVFWGSAAGYSDTAVTRINLDGSVGHNIGIADFDRDGRLDLAAVPWTRASTAIIYWGTGRSEREIVRLPVSDGNPHGVTTADFDFDGWLDLVFPGYDTVVTAYIYYGGPDGFSVERRELIHPGPCYGGSAAALWDDDSAPDLVFFRGDYEVDTSLAPRVYFNYPESLPHFSDSRYLDICTTGFNASGGIVTDFNRDGALDVYVDGYSLNANSTVLWGPDWIGTDTLPTRLSHHGIAAEPGNSYDRDFHEQYLSSVYTHGVPLLWGRITWLESVPGGSTIEIEFRSGEASVPDSTWSGWVSIGNGGTVPESLAARSGQYRATFRYDNPSALPILHEIIIELDIAPMPDVGPTEILAPVGVIDSGTVVVPAAVVSNFGNRAASFPVSLLIGTDYSETVFETLAAGASDTVRFPQWTAHPVGTVPATCFTALEGDIEPANDTIRIEIEISPSPPPDVGVTAILAPSGSVDSGTVYVPIAVVENFGLFGATFPVTMSIGSGYSQTIDDSLGPGGSDTVRFPAWSAIEVGTLPVVSYTALTGDGNPANDTLSDTVRVMRGPVPDVAAIEIIAPRGYADSGSSHIPAGVVTNLGTTPSTFPVVLLIGTGYRESTTVTLEPDQTDTLLFPAWTALPVGVLPVVCYTGLAGDPNPTNDTARALVTVEPPGLHDIGTAAILSPLPSAFAGDTLVPVARIRNFGLRPERHFDVRLRIGDGYSMTLTDTIELAPDSTHDLSFPPWVAVPGTHTATCSTRLRNDADPSNDRLSIDVRVGRRTTIIVEPDITDSMPVDTLRLYRFYAVIDGDSDQLVGLVSPETPTGWSVWLSDSAGTVPLGRELGVLSPGIPRYFGLAVRTPGRDLAGVGDSLATRELPVVGFISADPAISDTAVVRLTLVPGLEVHNFPNPLSDETRFVIGLPQDGWVNLTIYNRAGERICRLVRDRYLTTGIHIVQWKAVNDRGRPVGSGTYHYVFEYQDGAATERLAGRLVVIREQQ